MDLLDLGSTLLDREFRESFLKIINDPTLTQLEKINKIVEISKEKNIKIQPKLLESLKNEQEKTKAQIEQIVKEQEIAKQNAIAGLNMKELDSLSIFNDKNINRGEDVVRVQADEYFLENIKFHLDSKILKIFEWKKPVLDQERLNIIDGDDIKLWYTKFASLWLVTIANEEESLKGKIKSDIIIKDFGNMVKDEIYIKQMLLLYNYAYLKKNQQILLYSRSVESSKEWAKAAKEYYKSKEYELVFFDKIEKEKKIARNIQSALNKIHAEPLYDIADGCLDISKAFKLPEKIKEINVDTILIDIRTRLDYLDKSGWTSIDVLLHLYLLILTKHSTEGGIKNEVIQEQIKVNVRLLSKEFLKSEDSENPFKQFFKEIQSIAGNGLSVTSQILIKIQEEHTNFKKKNSVAPLNNEAELEIAEKAIKDHPQSDKVSLIKMGSQIFASLFRACQAMIILSGIPKYNKNTTLENTQYISESMAMCGDYLTSFDMNNVGSKLSPLAKRLYVHFTKFKPEKVAKFFSNLQIFTSITNEFITYRICPVLLLISSISNVVDAITSWKEGNWGGLVLDVTQFALNWGSAFLLFSAVPWAAVGALILGAFTIGLYIIKKKFFPAKSPTIIYYESESFPIDYKQ